MNSTTTGYDSKRMFERDANPNDVIRKGIDYIGQVASSIENERFLFNTEDTQIMFGKLLSKINSIGCDIGADDGLIAQCCRATDKFSSKLLSEDSEKYSIHRTSLAELQTYFVLLPDRKRWLS